MTRQTLLNPVEDSVTTITEDYLALEGDVIAKFEDLAASLEALSEYIWQGQSNSPVIPPDRKTLDILQNSIDEIMVPVKEIRSAF